MEKCNKYSLKEMKIQENLTMEKIYKFIGDYILIHKQFEKNTSLKIDENYEIQIFNQVNYSINFTIKDDSFNIFIKPIKYQLKINEKKSIDLDIIAISQLKEILKNFPFNKALLFCPQCNPNYFELKYDNLIKHEKHSGACIKESMEIEKLDENHFNNFFKENFDFIKKKLKPLEFEPNFKIYFKNSEVILEENNLYIYEDIFQKRINIYNEISPVSNNNSLVKFFGQPGKGKTLILIGILKYMTNHIHTGTFYINCKALFTLKEPIEMKQLIIEEIPFLFYKNYQDYSECAEKLINYNMEKNSSFFSLINLVIDYLIINPKKKGYIIVLDQYKDKIENNKKELDILYEKLIQNKAETIKNVNFSLITFSSMNNQDIKNYKVQYINNILDKKDCKGYSLKEIENIEYSLSIDGGGIYDQNLESLGNGLKYYNILKYYYKNNKYEFMLDFIKTTKLNIRENLLNYFNIDKEDISNSSNLKLFWSFSVGISYSEHEIKNINGIIPYKYFDIIRDKTPNEYKIIFSFPIVGELVNEIYSDIINTNPNLYYNLTKFSLDGGAKGKFFEKIITYYLNIKSSIYNGKKYIEYFKDFPINYHEEMNVLVLNDNESFKKILFDKYLIEGKYLITQKRYNGKALDIALINVSGINEIIGIQISIHKIKIFSQSEVHEFLLSLKKNVKKYYGLDVKEENLYFFYIFEWSNKDSSILRKCINNGVKYIFFDVINKSFIDEFGNKIENLKLYLISPPPIYPANMLGDNRIIEEYFIKKPKQLEENEAKEKQNDTYGIINGPLIELNKNQKDSIKKYFQQKFRYKNEPDIKYKNSRNCFVSKFLEKEKDFCISKYNGDDMINHFNSIVLLTYSSNHFLITNNGGILIYTDKYSNENDYYTID